MLLILSLEYEFYDHVKSEYPKIHILPLYFTYAPSFEPCIPYVTKEFLHLVQGSYSFFVVNGMKNIIHFDITKAQKKTNESAFQLNVEYIIIEMTHYN